MKPSALLATILLTLTLCPILAFLASAQTANAASDFSPEHLVVMVNGTDALGKPVRGAGLVVGKQEGGMLFVVTARHVTHSLTGAVNTLTVEFKDARGKQFPAYLQPAQFDKGLDLALLGIPPTDLPANLDSYLNAPVARLKDPAQPGEEVTLIGQTAGVLWARSPQPDKVGTARSTEIEVISNSGAPGLSGGAALDQNLNILGMVTSDDRGVIRVLPLRVVAEQLEKASYVFTLADVGGEKRSSAEQFISRMQAKDANGNFCGKDCLPEFNSFWYNKEEGYLQFEYSMNSTSLIDVDLFLSGSGVLNRVLEGIFLKSSRDSLISHNTKQLTMPNPFTGLVTPEKHVFVCANAALDEFDGYLTWQALYESQYNADEEGIIFHLDRAGPFEVAYGETRPACPLLDEKSEFLSEIKF